MHAAPNMLAVTDASCRCSFRQLVCPQLVHRVHLLCSQRALLSTVSDLDWAAAPHRHTANGPGKMGASLHLRMNGLFAFSKKYIPCLIVCPALSSTTSATVSWVMLAGQITPCTSLLPAAGVLHARCGRGVPCVDGGGSQCHHSGGAAVRRAFGAAPVTGSHPIVHTTGHCQQ